MEKKPEPEEEGLNEPMKRAKQLEKDMEKLLKKFKNLIEQLEESRRRNQGK